MKNLQNSIYLGVAALILASGGSSLSAAPTVYKFGVLPDTQWVDPDDGLSPTAIPASIVQQIDQAFIAQHVKLVIGVGDLTDHSSTPALEARALYAQSLYNAGIAFYPLRGNHEIGDGNDSATDLATYFPQIVNGGVNNTTPINTSSIPAIVTAWGSNSYDSSTTITQAAFNNNPPGANTGSAFTVGSNFQYSTATNVSKANGTLADGGASYSFDFGNSRFVLLDQFGNINESNTTQWPNLKGWFEGVIGGTSKPLNTFVFAHKNILGGNHKDNFFGTNVSGNDPGDLNASYGSAFTSLSTANQTAATTKATYIDQFISDMYNNGVRYFITGHDHHHAHSIVKSPLSNAWVEQIISQSASNKFYTPGSPYSPNETSVDEDLWSVGYYIYTVDGPRLTVDYYNVPVNTGGSDVYVSPVLTGNWAKALTFGSSKNGQTFSIAQGQPYTVIADTTTTSALPNAAAYGDTPSDYVSTGTTLSVLSGTNGSTATTHDGRHLTKIVNTGWSPANANGTISDVATIWGLSGIESSVNDTITVQVSFPAAAGSGNILLGSRDPVTGTWYNAADIDNVGGTKTFVNGPWTAGLPVGTYGVDHTNNVAWAVVNGTTRDFAVIANPNAIKGDLNNDGVVNAADTALLTAKIAAHTTDLTYDLNGDGKVDASDARWLIQHYTH